MTKIDLNKEVEYVIQLGNIRLTAYLHNSKTVISAVAVDNNEFIIVQPVSSNKIIIKSDNTILR